MLRNFFPVLIGNKIDLKYPYEVIDRDALDKYVESKSIKFYEASGKLYFNFENFFNKIFSCWIKFVNTGHRKTYLLVMAFFKCLFSILQSL